MVERHRYSIWYMLGFRLEAKQRSAYDLPIYRNSCILEYVYVKRKNSSTQSGCWHNRTGGIYSKKVFLPTYISRVRKSEWFNSRTIRSCAEKISYSRRFIFSTKRVPQNNIFAKRRWTWWVDCTGIILKNWRIRYLCKWLTSRYCCGQNAICYKYNNGLAEGNVNKIKLTKRIMYGRHSFQL